MRILALGGIAGPLVFGAVALVCAELRPGYSHIANFISELGATGTARAEVMNLAGFLPAGCLLLVFGISIGVLVPRDRATIAAAALLATFGTGVAASGIFSCDPGCPQSGGTTQNLIHDRIAPFSFLCAIVGSGLLAWRFRSLPEWRFLSWYSLASSGLALLFLALLAGSLETREITGLWQRLLLAVVFLWCSVDGVQGFRMSRPARAA